MLKIIGIIIIFSSCLLCGYDAVGSVKKRRLQADELCRFTLFLRDRIPYSRTPINILCRDFAESYNNAGNNKSPLTSGDIYDAADKISVFSPHMSDLLRRFIDELSMCGGDEAVDVCDYYGKQFEEERKLLTDEEPKKTRLYTALSMTAAAAAVVILI